jgi:hypothetical protein
MLSMKSALISSLLPTCREKKLKKTDCLNETAVVDKHNQVDGVEVLLTSEAAGKVGLLVCGGMEIVAQRTEKAQMVLRAFTGKFKNRSNEIIDRDLVTKRSQQCGREAMASHFSLSFVA